MRHRSGTELKMADPEPSLDDKALVETDSKPAADEDETAAAPQKVDWEGNSHGCTYQTFYV